VEDVEEDEEEEEEKGEGRGGERQAEWFILNLWEPLQISASFLRVKLNPCTVSLPTTTTPSRVDLPFLCTMSSSSPPLSPSRTFEFKASATPFVPSFSLPPSSSSSSSASTLSAAPLSATHTNHRHRHLPPSTPHILKHDPTSPSNNPPYLPSLPNASPPSSPSSLLRAPRQTNVAPRHASAHASSSKGGGNDASDHSGGVEAKGRCAGGSGKKGRDRGEVLTNVVEFQFAKKEEQTHSVSRHAARDKVCVL
jgi:hypothetical protein